MSDESYESYESGQVFIYLFFYFLFIFIYFYFYNFQLRDEELSAMLVGLNGFLTVLIFGSFVDFYLFFWDLSFIQMTWHQGKKKKPLHTDLLHKKPLFFKGVKTTH
jgi:hypothetical protein